MMITRFRDIYRPDIQTNEFGFPTPKVISELYYRTYLIIDLTGGPFVLTRNCTDQHHLGACDLTDLQYTELAHGTLLRSSCISISFIIMYDKSMSDASPPA